MISKEWKDYIERLEESLIDMAQCPCCCETTQCDEVDCTFAEDDPTGKENMEYAREILASRPQE